MKNLTMNRRTFLKTTALAGSGLLVGCTFSSPKLLSTPKATEEELGLWVRIGTDDMVTLILPSSEMGQQAHTGQAMILAEELEADWNSIRVVTAPVNPEYGNPQQNNSQATGGSYSISAFWDKLRQVGAGTREVLMTAAARQWGVPVSECKAENGRVLHSTSGRSLSYGQLAAAAAKLSPPDDPVLKTPQQFRLIGKSIPKLHTPAKVNGSAEFGIDVHRPGMLFAAVNQSPVFGGQVTSYDEKAAKAVKGVEAVVPIPNGVAVVADSTWHAKKGLEALKPEFEGGNTAGLDSAKASAKLRAALDEIGKAEIFAEKVLDVEYEHPYLHHATMEPMNCTAHVTPGSCEVWAPTQSQEYAIKAAKEVTGFSEEKIQIHTTLLGGGFGRRGEWDFVTQAVTVSKALQRPVQAVWSREEDTQHGFYRPASMSRYQVGLGGDGLPVRWESQFAQPNVLARFTPPLGWLDLDPMTIPASVHDYGLLPDHFYKVEGVNMTHTGVKLGVPTGFWRSPMNNLNVFYTESVMDELAHLAGQDPLEYRLRLMTESPRYRAVLEQVAKQAGWETPLPEGHGRGIAINDWIAVEETKTVVAEVAEVSVSKRGRLKVHRVDCVVDCGIAVNPDSVRAQMEGSIVMGMSAALFEQITLEDGRVAQSNFDDYRIARMRDTPEINVSIVKSDSAPTGTGEPGTSPIVPAITNAIFAATGKRIRSLPIGKQKLV
ncbi:MAG: molybdopterin-dependent oxidoreductase [SAR324 cluster bacterium]|nr:molybdopterin-dependent oxidoreductase [SAR324 cluster bacterium]